MFCPSRSEQRRRLPYWHLGTDQDGGLWQRHGPRSLLDRPAGATPTRGELRQPGVRAGFPSPIHQALRHEPGLLPLVARRALDSCCSQTLHADIVAATGIDLDGPPGAAEWSTEPAAIRPETTRLASQALISTLARPCFGPLLGGPFARRGHFAGAPCWWEPPVATAPDWLAG